MYTNQLFLMSFIAFSFITIIGGNSRRAITAEVWKIFSLGRTLHSLIVVFQPISKMEIRVRQLLSILLIIRIVSLSKV